MKYFGNSQNFVKYLESINFDDVKHFSVALSNLYRFIEFKIISEEDVVYSTPYNFNFKNKHGVFTFEGDTKKVNIRKFFGDVINQFDNIFEN